MWSQEIAFEDGALTARRLGRDRGFVWLDAQHPSTEGRYSFLACHPTKVLKARYGEPAPLGGLERMRESEDDDASHTEAPRAAQVPAWIGHVAYDAAWSEPARGRPRFDRTGDPVVWFGRYDAVIAIDHALARRWVIGDDRDACKRMLARLEAEPVHPEASVGVAEADASSDHKRAIERALEHIAAGDIYQVNLARRWNARFQGNALALWLAMRQASEVPLGCFLQTEEHAVLACTMERFVHWERATRRLVTRPIKGTLMRDDNELGGPEKLLADPKERAEHVMIVDLMRNDLGRVAATGTVRVEAPLVVEPYTGLYHMVSTVACETRDGIEVADILRATFPPGSVTGAPKVRAVEIIEELEQHPREVYCGAVGFVDRAGGCSFAVAIRTAEVRNNAVHYWAGGGLVAASDPDREVAETELKARVFLDALAICGEQRDVL